MKLIIIFFIFVILSSLVIASSHISCKEDEVLQGDKCIKLVAEQDISNKINPEFINSSLSFLGLTSKEDNNIRNPRHILAVFLIILIIIFYYPRKGSKWKKTPFIISGIILLFSFSDFLSENLKLDEKIADFINAVSLFFNVSNPIIFLGIFILFIVILFLMIKKRFKKTSGRLL